MRCLLPLIMMLIASTVRAEVHVQDAAGRSVILDAPARRIVALAPHIVENLFSAGAGQAIVGSVDYADFPRAAAAIPSLGSALTWSLEALVALQPDLVILWQSGNGSTALAQLERLGMTVYVSEPRRLEDIGRNIRDFGILAGSTVAATASADRLDRELARLRETYAGRESLSVFYEIWNSPLQTINGEHMISSVLNLCGGRNIFADTRQLAPQVSLESVLERDPDAIVASGMGEARPEWLDAWRDYPQLAAVRRDALLHVHPDLIQRPTTRIAEGAALLCQQLDSVRQ